MRILGKTENCFLLEADEETIAKLCGTSKWSGGWRTPKIGDKINVCDTWTKLKSVLALQEDFDKLNKTLSAIQDLLENVGGNIVKRIDDIPAEVQK